MGDDLQEVQARDSLGSPFRGAVTRNVTERSFPAAFPFSLLP